MPRLRNITFYHCSLIFFSFDKVDCENIQYTPPKSEYFNGYARTCETVKENYKRFRILYQSNGLREDASKAYYFERLFELRYLWYSSELFKTIFYIIRTRNFRYGFSKFAFHLKEFSKVISYSFSYIIWGFGEKPVRTLLFSLLILLIYTLIYYNSSIDTIGGNLINSFYLSTIMFTTLGFGDYVPLQAGGFKIIAASEALLGLFTSGLFIAGYANKAKY